MTKLLCLFLLLLISKAGGGQTSYKIKSINDCTSDQALNNEKCKSYDFEKNKVFGFSQNEVLNLNGSLNGDNACSKEHYQNDLSNRWCHANIVKAATRSMKTHVIFKHLIASSIFLPKEYFIDQKPSLADLVIAEYPLKQFNNDLGNVNVSIFGDGLLIFCIYNRF